MCNDVTFCLRRAAATSLFGAARIIQPVCYSVLCAVGPGRIPAAPDVPGSSVPTRWTEKSPQSVGPGQTCLILPVGAGAFSPSLFLVTVCVRALQDLWRTSARIDT